MREDLPITADDWATCLRVLQQVADDPARADTATRFKTLVAKVNKAGRKAEQRTAEDLRKQKDTERRARTEMVQTQLTQARVAMFPPPLPRTAYRSEKHPLPSDEFPETLSVAVRCYICKEQYHALHFFYHLLCPACARQNYEKRTQHADLAGRIALVTGGRVKIGYQTALRLLRDGAKVMVTTRFPRDAVRRYESEPDFAAWRDRLTVAAIDLRRPADVEGFTAHLNATLPHLDIVINNAAQTIRRPLAFYRVLLEAESEPRTFLPSGVERMLIPSRYRTSPLLEARADYPVATDAALLDRYFPAGAFDGDGQAVDARPDNSWTAKLGDISAMEVIEVLLVNTVAPFLLVSGLKSLLVRSPFKRRFVINVSAMEGQFTRPSKTAAHPHTNMAKAALNMLTRTSAQDLAASSIFMTSVDTGWITDENPLPKREHLRAKNDFYPPLDIVDGTARVYDPIVQGVTHARFPEFGVFLKDYRRFEW